MNPASHQLVGSRSVWVQEQRAQSSQRLGSGPRERTNPSKRVEPESSSSARAQLSRPQRGEERWQSSYENDRETLRGGDYVEEEQVQEQRARGAQT